jgi:hypothetical protein
MLSTSERRWVGYERAVSHVPPIVPHPHRVLSAPTTVREFFGRSDDPGDSGPQAFLIDPLPPSSRLGAHFHSVDQFQIFFPANGAWYQRTPIDRILVHYADAYTTYGPFGSGDDGLPVFTLRRGPSEVTGYMPADRHLLTRRGRRNVHVAVPPQPLPSAGWSREELLDPHSDGLAIGIVDIAPSASARISAATVAGGDRYLCVLAGRLRVGDREYGARSLCWERSCAGDFEAHNTSGEVLRLLVMQFPLHAGVVVGAT